MLADCNGGPLARITYLLGLFRKRMPPLGSLRGDAASSLAGTKFGVDFLTVVPEPCQVGSQRSLRRVRVLGLARALLLDLDLLTLLLGLGDGRELASQKGGEIELAKVEILVASEHCVRVADVRARGISERAFQTEPGGYQLHRESVTESSRVRSKSCLRRKTRRDAPYVIVRRHHAFFLIYRNECALS